MSEAVLTHSSTKDEGSFELKDSDGNVVTAKRRLLCHTTIRDGRIWYERPAGE